MSVLKLGAIALILSFCVSLGFAGNITVTPLCVTDNSGGGDASNWQIAGPNGGSCFPAAQTVAGDPRLPVTFVLPQNRANGEPTFEQRGDFQLNKPFVLPNGNFFVTINDPSAAAPIISDFILFGNTNGGNGEIFIFSDPTANVNTAGYTNAGVICTEDADGCIRQRQISILGDSDILITFGSDGENPFGLFLGAGDLSEFIRFENAVPEPSSLLLLLMALAVGVGVRRWVQA